MKTVTLALLAAMIGFNANADLNLKEKKTQMEDQVKVDAQMAKFKDSCGCAPKVTVDWEALANVTQKEDYRTRAMERGSDCAMRLSNAVGVQGQLCKDFKKEVCAGIANVKITGAPKGGSSTVYDKASKTLTLTTAGNGCDAPMEIKKTIEKSL